MTDTNDEAASSPRRRGFVVAAVFVAALLVAAVVALVLPTADPGQRQPSAAEPPVAGASATATDRGTAGAECDLPFSDQTVPRTTPTDTQWELVGRVAAPTAPETHGPAVTEPVRSCFARTPTGALYAAANALAATTLPDGGRVLAEDLAAEGPGRDVALDNLPDSPSTPVDSGAPFQLAGFSFLSWTEDETVIDLAVLGVADQQGVYAHTPMTLRWERGDWRLVYSPEGAPFPRVQALPGLAGYVPWSGT
ncbi:hypothetical protein [Aquipuribacter nitratireducens]|uniref:DUF8175 domain-containing protein n=1 Tax=Aquipuribacter nitratireducens TaxID=650104 RepID=A0ABW0GQ64_9MICO